MDEPIDFSRWIPIFPLPNVVLMPRAVLPLHVFEPRYRTMTRDALSGSRLIVIALLKPGFETEYQTLDVPIHREVCVGRILREERLPDGRFNFLLQGLSRAKVVRENKELEYRRGQLACIPPISADATTECAIQHDLCQLLHRPPLLKLATDANWLELFKCPDFTLSDKVDVLASALLPCAEDKQRFLAERCVSTRAICICNVLKSIAEELEQRDQCMHRRTIWPPKICNN